MNGNPNEPTRSCFICHSTERLWACKKCRSIWYCGQNHQAQDWKRHKPQCSQIAEARAQQNQASGLHTSAANAQEPRIQCHQQMAERQNRPGYLQQTVEMQQTQTQHRQQIAAEMKQNKRHCLQGSETQTHDQRSQSFEQSTAGTQQHKTQCYHQSKADAQELVTRMAKLNLSPINQRGRQTPTPESDEQVDPSEQLTDPHIVERNAISESDSFPTDKVGFQLSAAESGEHDDPSEHLAEDSTVDRNLSPDLPKHVTCDWLIKVSDHIVKCLEEFGCAVVDKLMGKIFGERILQEAKSLQERQLMTDGLTLQSSDSQPGDSSCKQKYRMDKISWVNGVEPYCNNIGFLVTLLDNLIQHAQRQITQYSIKGRTKAMIACYPGEGAGYVKHVDNPAKDGRLLTCIYYLNKDWDCKADGGMLRIFPVGSNRTAHIEPIMDRLVVFWSDKRNPHEVRPAFQTRFAVTVWYFDAKERTEAIEREARKKCSNNQSPSRA